MRIHYRSVENGIEIVRCFGDGPEVVLPRMIEGQPIVCVAPYTFSARKAKEDEDVLVYDTRQGMLGAEESHLLAGMDVETIVFPDTVRAIGNYIFYGCKALRSLTFSDALQNIGSGAFTGCSGLSEICVRMKDGEKSCVKEILGELWQRIDIKFTYENQKKRTSDFSGINIVGETNRSSELFGMNIVEEKNRSSELFGVNTVQVVFPEHYEEAVENTPARILFTQHHGSGNHYRQCFYNKKLDLRKYDEVFVLAKAQEPLDVLVDLVFARLEGQKELTVEHREEYFSFLRERLSEIGKDLVQKDQIERLAFLSRQSLWTKEALDEVIEEAARVGNGEVLSFLMNEKHEKYVGTVSKKKRFEL